MYKHVTDTSVRAECPGSPGNHERLDMPTIYCAEMYANYDFNYVHHKHCTVLCCLVTDCCNMHNGNIYVTWSDKIGLIASQILTIISMLEI